MATTVDVPVEHVLVAHRERLCTYMDKMRKNNVMCDVTVICETTEFTAHKVILSASSSFFHNKFTEDINRLQVPEVGPDIMEMILSFIYTGNVLTMNDTTVQLILAAAHHLRVTHLYHWCRERLVNGLTLTNMDHIWDIADLYSDPFLQSQVAQFAAKNFKKLVRKGAFINLPVERLLALIGNDRLVESHPDEVLVVVLNWVKHDAERRQRVLPDIIPHIKFDQLSAQLINSLDGNPTVMGSLELLQAFTKTMAQRYQRGSALHARFQDKIKKRGIEVLTITPSESYAPVNVNDGDTSRSEEIIGSTTAATALVIRRNNGISIFEKPSINLSPTVFLNSNGITGNYATDKQNNGNHQTEPILVVFGQDKNEAVVLQTFSLQSKQWGAAYVAPVQKKFASIIAHKGLIYILGGKVNLKPSSSAHVCDIHIRRTRPIQDMNFPRCGMGVAELDGLIYVVGGYNKAGWLKDVESYDSVSNSWEIVAPLREGKEGVGVVVAHRKLYAIGGVPVPTTEVYDPMTDQWTKLERMRHARVYHGISKLDGILYVVGGFGHHPDRIQCYDYENGTWTELAPRAPQQCRDTWCAAVTWNNRILVINSEGLLWDFDARHETWNKLPSSFNLVGGYISSFISATIL